MTGKRSVIAKAARRKAYSIRKEKKKADAARRVSTLAKGRSPNCPESTDYLKNSLDLFEFASEYSKLHCEEQGGFQDGTGTMANPPDWSSSAVLRPKKSKNPVTSILLDVIDKFGLEDLMRSCDTRTSPTPFSFMKLAKAFDEAATVARHALCKYLHVNNVPASSGAAFYAELYVALLQRSGDEDAGLKDLLINPHGFPAAILRNIPESGIFPVYQPNEMKILVHEPSSLAARFRRHYLSAERASDRLFSSVMSEIRQGKMQQESSEDGLTFVRCALIAKKGSPPEADLSDPEVAVRIVEDYSANGVNRLSVQNHLLHESPVLPQLSDYELVLRLIATHSQKTGISWGVGGLDYKAAFHTHRTPGGSNASVLTPEKPKDSDLADFLHLFLADSTHKLYNSVTIPSAPVLVMIGFTLYLSITVAFGQNIPLNQWPMIRTHDAATGYISRANVAWRVAKTQEGNLAQQLDCGARAFDLRLACKLLRVRMHHGALIMFTQLEDVLKDAIGWANARPDELVVVSLSHYEPDDDECRWKVWKVLADLKLMQSIGSDGSCEKLRGLTVDGAKNMSKLEGGKPNASFVSKSLSGGHLFVLGGEAKCSDANWDPSVVCYRGAGGGDCHQGSENSKEINKELFDYIEETASETPLPTNLFSIPAHWQCSVESASKMALKGSNILEDAELSEVNNPLVDFIPQLKYINFLQVDNVCYYGPQLLGALRAKAFSHKTLRGMQQ
ncbi:hypothetical protein FOL47_007312 [Perkinsus chesapeaki]|uniref:Uncharacterized protein n=1 Tax=Perkinsus chesapeaki TaxID=330153 RepID=A0A7J6LLG8_PERCH|nr:hypothetical protein FOL47_007312 [Perkinsus chesapeaki]